jgi:signal transduction histidine kinase
LLAVDHRGFFRSRAGRGFLVFVLLCAGLSAIVGYGIYQSNLHWFVASKTEEKLTALELVDSFFATYSELRGQFPSESVAVPATFRAHAIERFNRARDPNETLRLVLVGVPGQEIRIPPSDPDMAEAVRALSISADPRPTTRHVVIGDQPFLRTLHPSIATQPSCVECHNAIQPGQNWKLNDLMGAYAIDVPLAPFLRATRREAFVIGGIVFVLACGLGLYVFLLQFRAFASDVYKRLSDAVANLADGFAIYDAQGTLVLNNPAHRRYAAINDQFPLPAPGEASSATRGAVSREVALPDDTWIHVSQIRTQSGDIVRVESDISALKQREIELRSAKDQADQANHAKSEFLALMSHELRTPLNAINGFSEIIRNELFGPVSPRYRAYANDINDSGQYLLSVINDILDMAKVEAGKIDLAEDRVNVASMVDGCFRLLGERAQSGGLTLAVEVPSSLRLIADELRLKQVLVNLLSNSVKFTPSGGTVSVTATIAADGSAILAVADTGIGIAAEHIPDALAPFGQVDSRITRKYGGTGLGLPLSRGLVDLHGGTLTIESTPGRGTVVSIVLPARRVLKSEEPVEETCH